MKKQFAFVIVLASKSEFLLLLLVLIIMVLIVHSLFFILECFMKREMLIHHSKDDKIDISSVYNTVCIWLQSIPYGEWSLQLKKVQKSRSLSQNALLWMWMTVIAKEWADATDEHFTKEQFKEFFARKFIPVTSPDGETVGGSTSSLTVEQMSEFLTNIHVWVSENLGINLPNAEDKFINEWYSQYEED